MNSEASALARNSWMLWMMNASFITRTLCLWYPLQNVARSHYRFVSCCCSFFSSSHMNWRMLRQLVLSVECDHTENGRADNRAYLSVVRFVIGNRTSLYAFVFADVFIAYCSFLHITQYKQPVPTDIRHTLFSTSACAFQFLRENAHMRSKLLRLKCLIAASACHMSPRSMQHLNETWARISRYKHKLYESKERRFQLCEMLTMNIEHGVSRWMEMEKEKRLKIDGPVLPLQQRAIFAKTQNMKIYGKPWLQTFTHLPRSKIRMKIELAIEVGGARMLITTAMLRRMCKCVQ